MLEEVKTIIGEKGFEILEFDSNVQVRSDDMEKHIKAMETLKENGFNVEDNGMFLRTFHVIKRGYNYGA